jgi:CheY-like chemotaxis protein
VRILIVDDEALARAYLAEQLAGEADVEIAGQAANGFDAVKMAEEVSCDLMLLDVQMPKLSGFEVMELLGARAPAVIFVTAHDEFAVQAFQIHAVDYLLKPVEPTRLQQALQRARERLGDPVPDRAALTAQVALAARPAGRLPGDLRGGQALSQAADSGPAGSAAGPCPVRAHPPVLRAERRAHCPHRALRQGQLAGLPERWQPSADVPQWLPAPAGSTGLTSQPVES